MDDTSKPFAVQTLLGDELEQLYQLGLNDRDRHEALHHQVRHFLSTPYPLVDRAAQQLAGLLVKQNLENHPSFAKRMGAYAQGLGKTTQEVAITTLIPELVSSLSKWLPGLPGGLMGCSSFFMLEQDNHDLVHGRVLDFPVQDSFDKNERGLFSRFGDQLGVFSLGSQGLPFHSVTGMNEAGVTLGLHQKFTDVFLTNGASIFNIAHEFLQTVETSSDALAFLKERTSITTWCFCVGFAREKVVLEIDMMGDKIVHQKYELTSGDVLYFHNQLVSAKARSKPALPIGLTE